MLLIVWVEGDSDYSFFSRLLTRLKSFVVHDLARDSYNLGLDRRLEKEAFRVLKSTDKTCFTNGGNVLLLLKDDGRPSVDKAFIEGTSESVTSGVDVKSLLIIDSDKARNPHDQMLPVMRQMAERVRRINFESTLNSRHPLPNTSVLTMTKHSKTMEAWGMTVDSSMEDLLAHIIRKHHLLRRDAGGNPDDVFEKLIKQESLSSLDEMCDFLFEKTDLQTCSRVKSLIDGLCRFAEN